MGVWVSLLTVLMFAEFIRKRIVIATKKVNIQLR